MSEKDKVGFTQEVNSMSKVLCSTGALLEYGGDYRLLESLLPKVLAMKMIVM